MHSTPPTNTPTSGDAFRYVCSIERPLTSIRNFRNALALITETMDEPAGSAVNQITWAMLDQVAEVDAEFSTLFKLSPPDHERFEREGWRGRRRDGQERH